MAKKNLFIRNERVKASVKSTNGFFKPGLSPNYIVPDSDKKSESEQLYAKTIAAKSVSRARTMATPAMFKTTLAKQFESNEEVGVFLEQPDFECNEIDAKTSTKTNFYTLNNNWLNLVKYLKNLKAAVKWLWEHIQIESLVDAVLEKLEKQKNMIVIPNTLLYNSQNPVVITYVDQNTGKTYTIERVSEHCVSIKREPDWKTEMLMVVVKDVNYTSVNVAVTTSNNEIRLDFLDGQITTANLQSTYYVYFI